MADETELSHENICAWNKCIQDSNASSTEFIRTPLSKFRIDLSSISRSQPRVDVTNN